MFRCMSGAEAALTSLTIHAKPNAQGKRRRSTEGAQGTNTGQENGEAMASIGVGLTAELGWCRTRGVRALYSLVELGIRNRAIAQ